MTIKIDGENLMIEDLAKIARKGEEIVVEPEAMERVKKSRDVVEKLVEKREKVYGVTTGIGELANVILTPEQVKDFQRYLIYSHTAGWGEPVKIDDARAAITARINILSKGCSGLRPKVLETLVDMVNKGVIPVMCQKGSVGASRDLSPLAQMALVPIGEGEAFYKGERLPGKEAMDKAGIDVVRYEARDGLAVINGATLIAGMGALQIYDAIRWIKTSEIAAAMTIEALKAVLFAYDERLHKVTKFEGQMKTAENIRKLIEGSGILGKPEKVQDAYSLRSTPQVTGAARESITFSRSMIEKEINGAQDNPLFLPEDGVCLTGANFQGQAIAFGLEALGTAITTVCGLSERRLNRLLDPNLSNGLPGFLTKGAGMFSGMMVAQYTAAALVNENRVLSAPATVGSIPVSGNQEDYVSMGMTTAIKTREILKNANAILAIELMAAAQGLDYRKPQNPGKGVQVVYNLIRKYVEPLEEDRPLCNDIDKIAKLVGNGKILEVVEKEIGELL